MSELIYTQEKEAKQGSSTYKYYLCLNVYLNAQNTANKTSNVTIELTLRGSNNGTLKWNTSEANSPKATVRNYENGVYVDKNTAGIRTYTTSTTPIVVSTWTGDIQHNSDGTCVMLAQAYWKQSTSVAYPPVTTTITSGDIVLPVILANVYTKISGEWVSGTGYIKIDGIWENVVDIYTKVGGEWEH